MTGYERGTVQPGDLVSWRIVTRGTFTGRVLAVLPREHTQHIAGLTGSNPTEAWERFGPLCLVVCTDPECRSCKGGWPGNEGWKHQVNECQLERVTADVEVPLW